MRTEKVQTMVAPQPPRLRTEPPSAVSRKLGFASATTKPSNQLIALISSRSSTEATAMATSLVPRVYGSAYAIRPGGPRQGYGGQTVIRHLIVQDAAMLRRRAPPWTPERARSRGGVAQLVRAAES